MDLRNKVNCQKCRYFYISWKKNYPYGCKAFSMETKYIPSRHVFIKSKANCYYYNEKKKELN